MPIARDFKRRSWERVRVPARAIGELRSSQSGLGAGYVPAAPVLSGTYITPQTALGLTAVYAAIRCISQDLARLPLALYDRLPDGGYRLDPTDYYSELLGNETDDDTDSMKWTLDTSGHTLGWGNSYNELVRNNRTGQVESVHILHPSKTAPKRNKSGRLIYKLDNDRELSSENVLQFSGLGFDGIQGYTPLTVCRQSIGVGMASEQFGAAFFGNGAVAHGLLKYPKRLSEQAQSNLRRSINQVHQGAQNAHQFLILEEGAEWVNTQVSPEDAQFLGTRQFTVLEIARIYGVPPHKLGDYSQAHLANVEESNRDYLDSTLGFWVALREHALNRRLLTRLDRKRYVLMYDLTALLRANTQVRTSYYQTMRNMGAMSADDIRISEGMNPIGAKRGGDLYLVQSQYTRLDQAGQAPAPAPPPGAKQDG